MVGAVSTGVAMSDGGGQAEAEDAPAHVASAPAVTVAVPPVAARQDWWQKGIAAILVTALVGMTGLALVAVNGRFDEISNRFNDVNERFDDIGGRLDRVDQRFDRLEERFDRLEAEVGEIKVQIALLIAALGQTEAVDAAASP